MQGIAGDYFTLGLERFWIEANLPQKLLKKSSDKRGARPFQSAACANFAAEKSHARCGLLSDNLNVMEKEKRPIAQATRAEQGREASVIPLFKNYLWGQLAMRHYIKRRTIKKRLTECKARSLKARLTLAIPLSNARSSLQGGNGIPLKEGLSKPIPPLVFGEKQGLGTSVTKCYNRLQDNSPPKYTDRQIVTLCYTCYSIFHLKIL